MWVGNAIQVITDSTWNHVAMVVRGHMTFDEEADQAPHASTAPRPSHCESWGPGRPALCRRRACELSRRDSCLDYCSADVAPIDALAGGLVQLFFSGLGQPRAASNLRRPAPRSEPVLIANKRAHLQGSLRGIGDAAAPSRSGLRGVRTRPSSCAARDLAAPPLRAKRDPRVGPARAHIRRAARAPTTMEPRRTNR